MINNLKLFFTRVYFITKVFFSNLFSIKVEGRILSSDTIRPISRLKSYNVKQLKTLKIYIDRNENNVDHETMLQMLVLSARVNSSADNSVELREDLKKIIKVCIDWHTKYKESEEI